MRQEEVGEEEVGEVAWATWSSTKSTSRRSSCTAGAKVSVCVRFSLCCRHRGLLSAAGIHSRGQGEWVGACVRARALFLSLSFSPFSLSLSPYTDTVVKILLIPDTGMTYQRQDTRGPIHSLKAPTQLLTNLATELSTATN
jgi:hypothetical protein